MLMTLCNADTPTPRYADTSSVPPVDFPPLFTLVGGEALEGLVQFLIGAFNAVWNRDLARHHCRVVADENLLDLLEISRRGHRQSVRQGLIIERCTGRVGEEGRRLGGRFPPGHAPAAFALLLLRFDAGEFADKLLGEVRVFRRL